MDPALPLLGIGLALGIRHAADSDHVVAVTAIAARHQRIGPAAILGALWGLGHTLTIFAVGSLIIVLNLAVPPRIGLALEFAVGIALTTVGVLNVAGHGGFFSPGEAQGRRQWLRAFVVGLVHGLAGSAGLALLALTAAPTLRAGLAYLAIFGLGSIAGMLLLSALLSVPLAYVEARYAALHRAVQMAAGAVSVAFGLYLLWEHTAGASAAAWLS